MQNELKSNGQLATIEFPYASDVIKDRAEKYAKLIITDNKTYNSTKQARTELVSIRTSIEKALKAGNEPLNNQIKANREEAERLIDLAKPTEEYLQKTVKDYESKKKAEREAKIQAERERVASIRARIQHITDFGVVRGLSAAGIKTQLMNLEAIGIDDGFEEFKDEAQAVKDQTILVLEEFYAEQAERERQDEARKAEAERLRLEAEKQAQERAEFEAKQAAAQAELDRQREAIEAQQREAQAKAEVEEKARQDQIRKEREEIERMRREVEQQKALTEQEEQKHEQESAGNNAVNTDDSKDDPQDNKITNNDARLLVEQLTNASNQLQGPWETDQATIYASTARAYLQSIIMELAD